VDNQLLIYFPFSTPVKIHSLSFLAPKDDSRSIKKIKLYANKQHLDFESIESVAATQEIVLKKDDLIAGSIVSLKFVKFQNVNSLTIFVVSNQGDAETSILQNLRILGISTSKTNMTEFKRVSGEKGESHT